MLENVLFITHHGLVGKGGGVYATRAFLTAFASITQSLTVLHPIDQNNNITIKWLPDNVKHIPVDDNSCKIAKFFHLLFGKVHRYHDVFNIIKPQDYDLIVFDNSRCSFGLIDKAHEYGVKTIVIHHNYEVEYNKDNSLWYIRPILLYWTKRYERDAICKGDLNLTLTKQDKVLLAKAYSCTNTYRIKVLGCFEYENTTPVNDIKIYKCDKPYHFVISGNLSAMQTEDSLIPWIVNYFEILMKVCPNAQLTIAGKNPSHRITKICAEKGISLIPNPDNMDDVIRMGSVYICPISKGGGIKLRVMDGLRNGLPVLCHSVSERGYDVFKEGGYLISYHDAQSFEYSLLQIISCQYDRKEIIKKYEDNFSLDSGIARLKNLLFLNGVLSI